MGRVAIDQTIRAGSVAQTLIESGCALPATVTESVVRPLTAFEDSDLQASLWQLAEAFGPKRGPTTRLVSKLCHVVRDCLDNPYDDVASEPDAETPSKRQGVHLGPSPFIRPVARLASWDGFSVTVIIAGADSLKSAANLYRNCGILSERCRQVQARLVESYPEISDGFSRSA